MSVNDLEIDFISSLKALMVRYGVEISFEGKENEDKECPYAYYFSNDSNFRSSEIYLSIDEIFEYLNR